MISFAALFNWMLTNNSVMYNQNAIFGLGILIVKEMDCFSCMVFVNILVLS